MEGRDAPRAHRGSRRAARPPRSTDRRTVALALAAVVATLAWGGLVYAGIRFGQSARAGDGAAWGFLAVAGLGAVACLFLAMMLAVQVARALGVSSGSTGVKGGRRSAGRRVAPRRPHGR